MPRKKNNNKQKNQNNRNSKYQDDEAKKVERRRKRKSALKRHGLLTSEQKASKAKKREHQRRKAQNDKMQRSVKDYFEEDLRLVHKNGQICLMGRRIESFALQMSDSVPESAVLQRRLAEGYPHHITIAGSLETYRRMRTDKMVEAMNKIAAAGSPPVNLGLGMVQNEENDIRSWHCVISWPTGQQIRNAFGLSPRNLHLTLGFQHKDLNVPKGPSTLIQYNSPALMTCQQIESLIFAALIESYTSKEGSLISLMLASAQAKLIGDEYLILAAKHSLNRVQRGERLEEFEEKCTESNSTELEGFMQYNISKVTAEMESLTMAQRLGNDFPFYEEESDFKTTAVKDVITKLESLKVDQQ
ncbi:hypothetical protein NQZ79_g8571 [Umbelopsis isabellina]|nr:hypothetical protein NQZ79_g8571 [Umbelopsis isabellina]